MATDPAHRRPVRPLALTIAAILALLGFAAAPASASAGMEQEGARLLQNVQAGGQKCQQLSRNQFEAIGEYVMGRMVGSPARHEAMDQRIRAGSGASGEAEAHVFLGRRFSGCETGAAPAAFGSLMGMMGGYSGVGGGTIGEGYDGYGPMGGYGPGMGGYWARADDDWSTGATVALILLAAMAAALVALAATRRRRGLPPSSQTPLDLLSRRYAAGEMDTTDYERRRRALEDLT